MAGPYRIQRGDWMAKIAATARDIPCRDWTWIWKLGDNEKVRQLSDGPHILWPDRPLSLTNSQRDESRGTGAAHKFVVPTQEGILRLRLVGLDGAALTGCPAEVELKDAYLFGDGPTNTVQVLRAAVLSKKWADDCLEIRFSGYPSEATVRLSTSRAKRGYAFEFGLQIGHLLPLCPPAAVGGDDQVLVEAVQQRLSNLQYYHERIAGRLDPATRKPGPCTAQAVREFQADHGLPIDADGRPPRAETRAKLKDVHDGPGLVWPSGGGQRRKVGETRTTSDRYYLYKGKAAPTGWEYHEPAEYAPGEERELSFAGGTVYVAVDSSLDDRKHINTVALPRFPLIYVDAGAWNMNARNFAVINGSAAWVCDFLSKDVGGGNDLPTVPPKDCKPPPANLQFLDHLQDSGHQVRLLFQESLYPTTVAEGTPAPGLPYRHATSDLVIVLPDLHLPAFPATVKEELLGWDWEHNDNWKYKIQSPRCAGDEGKQRRWGELVQLMVRHWDPFYGGWLPIYADSTGRKDPADLARALETAEVHLVPEEIPGAARREREEKIRYVFAASAEEFRSTLDGWVGEGIVDRRPPPGSTIVELPVIQGLPRQYRAGIDLVQFLECIAGFRARCPEVNVHVIQVGDFAELWGLCPRFLRHQDEPGNHGRSAIWTLDPGQKEALQRNLAMVRKTNQAILDAFRQVAQAGVDVQILHGNHDNALANSLGGSAAALGMDGVEIGRSRCRLDGVLLEHGHRFDRRFNSDLSWYDPDWPLSIDDQFDGIRAAAQTARLDPTREAKALEWSELWSRPSLAAAGLDQADRVLPPPPWPWWLTPGLGTARRTAAVGVIAATANGWVLTQYSFMDPSKHSSYTRSIDNPDHEKDYYDAVCRAVAQTIPTNPMDPGEEAKEQVLFYVMGHTHKPHMRRFNLTLD